jgi:hypothetical protein
MMDSRVDICKEIIASLPEHCRFRYVEVHSALYELVGDHCVIRIAFDRYENSICGITVYPNGQSSDPNSGMEFLVLRHLFGARPTQSGTTSYGEIGAVLSQYMSALLIGDFSISAKYQQYESRILDRMSFVLGLDDMHPIRCKYNNYDLSWLDDLEASAAKA